ncbi:type I-B CRISPR-associated protein Cas5b [Dehalococcoidia bacterium]|nr:type I-B CRISPR-associated protein Cas5b [Dehalococcoidia bacterium]
MPDQFIVFDVWGDYAHFKKHYTTSSPLTFTIPPRTTVTGLVSAVIGLGKDEYLHHMTKDKAHVAVRLLNTVRKTRLGMNLINTKDGYWTPVKKGFHEPRRPIRFELLKDPRFRIYFSHQDLQLHEALMENLKAHKSVYTPCLGTSELIANFSYIGQFRTSAKGEASQFIPVVTTLPMDVALDINLMEPGYKFFKERMPTEMQAGRDVTEYREVLYEIQGKPIHARLKESFLLENDEYIVTL